MKSDSYSNNHNLSRKKSLIFKIGAILFSIVLLILFEIILRLVGYGNSYDLFIEDKTDTSNWVLNPEVSKKYFSNGSSATTGIPKPFKKVKKPNTFRIFVLGASTGIGYPYRYNGAFHHWLEYGLNRTFPDQNIEVVNVSLTAINSYTLLDFTKQIVHYEPNAVLIYAGHNEYYGALGVASTSSFGKKPWMVNSFLKLRTLRITQLISNGLSAVKSDEKKQMVEKETLMKKMVQDQKIPFNSDLYQLGVKQFETNLNAILDILEKNKVPCFVGTLVSNIKDVKPFISEKDSTHKSAQYYFDLAKQQVSQKQFKAAKLNFINAKEQDLLRFRAPESMNEIIRNAVEKHSNAKLVDSQTMFENFTEEGIIGNELLLEHVHPNIKGYALIGFAFYEKLSNSKITSNWKYSERMTFEDLWNDMPITALDSLAGTYEIMMMKEGWPYYEKIPQINSTSLTKPEQIAGRLAIQNISWDEASQRLFQYHDSQKDNINALKVIEGATIMYPTNAEYYEKAGNLAIGLNLFKKADYLYGKAFGISKSMEMAKRIARSYIENEGFEGSLFYLDAIKTIEPNNQFAIKLYDIASTIIKLQQVEDDIESNAVIGIELAENYISVGNTERAEQVLNTVLRYHPNNNEAKNLIKNLN